MDIVANLETIGPLLYDLLTGAYVPIQPDDQNLLRAFLEQLRERSGIDFGTYKTPTIMRRLQRRLLAVRSESLADYARYVQRNPEEYQRLVSSFLIKVTEFFRDQELFTYLREQVLPGLIQEARRRNNELRLWSAGCATGEEAYSLAILVADVLGEELSRFTVRIFERFVQAGAESRATSSGLGLGLFIAREVMLAHGGAIDVESSEGQGATFTVRLPRLARSSASARGVRGLN